MGGDDNNGNGNGNGTTPTPEPGGFALLASGILGLFAAWHRKFSELREGH
jgi:PEP-CTERM motif